MDRLTDNFFSKKRNKFFKLTFASSTKNSKTIQSSKVSARDYLLGILDFGEKPCPENPGNNSCQINSEKNLPLVLWKIARGQIG